ncbi:MAG: OsmC family protein [Candidatus Acetothermia bacterium]
MKKRKAEATWRGNLTKGEGEIELESGLIVAPYSFKSRFEEGDGTNPEELIGAAHAGCFSMALSNLLAEEGYEPREISTQAEVGLDKKDGDYTITNIHLITRASVPEIDAHELEKHAAIAKEHCPVSRALAGVDITLEVL